MFINHLSIFFAFLSMCTSSYAIVMCDTDGNCDLNVCVNGDCSYILPEDSCTVTDINGKCMDKGQWSGYAPSGTITVFQQNIKTPVCGWSYRTRDGNYSYAPMHDISGWHCVMKNDNIVVTRPQ